MAASLSRKDGRDENRRGGAFNCRWIVQRSIAHLGEYTYAVCQRNCYRDRIVNEPQCARCPLWSEFETVAGERERGVPPLCAFQF